MNIMELNEVLQLHKLWLEGDEEGHMANLSGADLCGADLSGADLSEANLNMANISVVTAGPMGRSDRITCYKYEIDEVDCGCLHGTLAEFEARIEETHKNNPRHLAVYRAAVAYFKAVRDASGGSDRPAGPDPNLSASITSAGC